MTRSLLVAVIVAVSLPAQAQTLWALNSANALLRFEAATPGTLDATLPLTGVPAGFTVRGLDFRPSTGALYVIAVDTATNTQLRLFTADLTTGALTEVSTAAVTVTPAGQKWGLSFNPVVDRLRVTNSGRASFRLNPNDGTMVDGDINTLGVQQDTALISANTFLDCAYDRSFAGATATTLYVINYTTDSLSLIGGRDGLPSPNDGAVTGLGAFGVSGQNTNGALEFAGPTLFMVLDVAGVSNLYRVNKTSGSATLVGAVGSNPRVLGLTSVETTRLLTLDGGVGIETDSITPAGAVDAFAVNIPTGSRFWALVDTGGTVVNPSASRDTYLRVLAPNYSTEVELDRGDGVANGEDSTIEGNNAALIAGLTPAPGGVHFLEIGKGSPGDANPQIVESYRLNLALTTGAVEASEAEPNDNAGQATSIGSVVLVRNGATSAGAEDWYAVTAAAGDVLMVAADGNPTRPMIGAIQTELDLELRGPSPGNAVLLSAAASNGLMGNELAEGFVFRIETAGTYFVRVIGVGSGAYRLMVQAIRKGPVVGVPDAGVPDAGEVDAGVVDAGVVDAGSPDAGDVMDAGTTADAGVVLQCRVDADCNTGLVCRANRCDFADGPPGSGCGCAVSSPWLLVLGALALLGASRRRRAMR